MTIQEKIEVMQAFADGKQIQFKPKTYEHDWIDSKNPDWDWLDKDYRIKPEPEVIYRPYKDFAEFRTDWEKHGGWAKDDRDCSYVMLHSFECAIAECLMVHFTWADDGTPCGVKVEE